MKQSIIQVKEQDTPKERARKLNDLAKLFDNRITVLENLLRKQAEEIEEINEGDDIGDRLSKIEDLLISTKFKKRWDDIQVSISTARTPAANAPTWRTYNYGIGGGIAYPALGFDTNDYVDYFIQTSHSQQLNTILEKHLHYTLPSDSAGDRFQFQLDVIAAGIGEDFAVVAGSPFAAEHLLTGVESGRHNYFDIVDIPGVNTTVSTNYIVRLTRIAATVNDYAPEVYVIFDDCHYLKDDNGSRQEHTK